MRRFFQGKSGFRQHGPGDGRDVSAHSNGNTAFFPAVFTENWCSLHFLTSMATTANERNFKTAVTTATPNASYRIVNPEGDFSRLIWKRSPWIKSFARVAENMVSCPGRHIGHGSYDVVHLIPII
ncbi:hypothetical protein ABFY27_06000 [Akkermansia massiliensis]